MKDFRIAVFQNNSHTDTYFDSKEEALTYGKQEASKVGNIVFLLRHIVDNKYDVVAEIK